MAPSSETDTAGVLRAALAGRYDIERELGAGGMAVVYLARDVARDRRVALKVLRPELQGALAADRFHREIRTSAGLVHRSIVPLLDSGESDGRLWYTMPFVEGESLRDRLARERQLPVDEAVRLTTEIAEALQYAHTKGILHRDIKPDNILLSEGHALLADFGIARALVDAGDERLTASGFTLGTPAYMSPEQSTAEHAIDARSDLYALASVCYEMLAGEPPFTGPTAQAVIARRLSQPPPSLRIVRPAVSQALDAVLQRALASVPADRYASVEEFSRALRGVVTGAVTGAPDARAGTRRRAWPAAVAAAAVVAIGAAAWFLASRGTATDDAEPPTANGDGVRLAVMPFRLTSPDTADRYLADGITEEVSATLANLGGLRVIDHGSTASLAREGRRLRDIARALRVDAIVDGDVQRAGNAVRVRVRLVDAASEEARWTQRYDHTTADIFQVQSEVATKVADVLRIQLAARETQALARPPTTNAQAYDLDLRGRLLVTNRGLLEGRLGPDRVAGLALLDRAIALDSNFALALATRALARVGHVFLADADPRLLDGAEADIRRALALDSTLAMAWKARADLAWNAVRGWQFEVPLADLRRAITYQPSYGDAHASLGSHYFHYGFQDEARRELDMALSLDPQDGCGTSTSCLGFSRPRVARVHWYRQRFDSALAVYERLPTLGGFRWEYAVVLGAAGRARDGIAVLDTVRRNGDEEASLALLHAMVGERDAALARIRDATARARSRSHFHHAMFTIACAYARLGMKGDAVAWLRRTAENGMPNYPLFLNDPNLAPLRGDPAYEALMGRLRAQHERYARLVRDG